jgi:hypothetical protein
VYASAQLHSSRFTVSDLRQAGACRRGRELHGRFADEATAGQKAQAFLFNVLCGVVVAVVNRTATSTP